MNKKIFTIVLIALCFLTAKSFGQQPDDKSVRIEITVKDGNKVITAPLRSASLAFSKSSGNVTGTDGVDKKVETKTYFFAIDFEKQDLNLLRAFMKNKSGLDGEITMVDSYGKLPTRKMEFTKATVDSLSEQLTGDYNSSYISISCATLIIDGVTIE